MPYLLLVLLFASCTKMHDIKNENGIDFLENVSPEITEAKAVEWEVGRKKNKVSVVESELRPQFLA